MARTRGAVCAGAPAGGGLGGAHRVGGPRGPGGGGPGVGDAGPGAAGVRRPGPLPAGVWGVVFPVGWRLWREHHRAAMACGVLTPLELVGKGDAARDACPADVDAAEVSYRLAAG